MEFAIGEFYKKSSSCFSFYCVAVKSQELCYRSVSYASVDLIVMRSCWCIFWHMQAVISAVQYFVKTMVEKMRLMGAVCVCVCMRTHARMCTCVHVSHLCMHNWNLEPRIYIWLENCWTLFHQKLSVEMMVLSVWPGKQMMKYGLEETCISKTQKSKLKTMLICFSDQEGIVHREFVPRGMTVNADFYCVVLRR